MKLVINKCYGGFGLSLLAQQRYLELVGKKAYFYHQTKYTFRDGVDEYERVVDLKDNRISIETYTEDLGESFTPSIGTTRKSYWYAGSLERNNLVLVQVVEELGSGRASGGCSALEVVDIPDDIEYEIDDYDGIESVHEAHRSW